MDLRIKEEELFSNISPNQRNTIKKSEKKGLSFQVIDQSQDIELTKTHFDSFQNAHLISAGRMTRPQETWDCMFDAILNAKATLFLAVKDDTIISYLFCGEFEQIAIIWSQVNIEEYEKEFSPRHFLEWNTIIYYQKKGFNFYIVGERYFGEQLFHHPTKKEQSIGQLKERYGGTMLPVIVWTGYLDKQLMQNEMSQMMNCYLENSNGCAFTTKY